MTIAELIKELSKYPADTEVELPNGGPLEEVHYCSDGQKYFSIEFSNERWEAEIMAQYPQLRPQQTQQSRHYQEPGILVEQAALADKREREKVRDEKH
jgi:hypothetical protein